MSDQALQPNPNIDPKGALVKAFSERWGLAAAPIFVEFEDHGYEANNCHISVKHRVLEAGGKRVHGWALWEYPEFIVAEFHSIWERPDGQLIDLTPPKFGASQVLFVADPACAIEVDGDNYLFHTDRTTIPSIPFSFQGNPTEFSHWRIAADHPELVRYCGKLGLPDTSPL